MIGAFPNSGGKQEEYGKTFGQDASLPYSVYRARVLSGTPAGAVELPWTNDLIYRPVDGATLRKDFQVLQRVARKQRKRFLGFQDPQRAMNALSSLDRNIPIYVDHRLGKNILGTEVATQLHRAGFPLRKQAPLDTRLRPSPAA